MAITQNTYTGNGSTVLYSFTFPYLDSADVKVSLNGTLTTAYTFANATTIQFATAPSAGVAIRIYRETDSSTTVATFYPGSSIKAADLNDNFTQDLYLAQEANNEADSATATANTALTNSNTAISTANSAVSTANSAVSTANSAVSTANAASAAAASAVSTANTASSNATTAVNTANAASASAASAVSTANSAVSTANAATSTANSALSAANGAVSTANTASSNASAAVSTANTASTNATNAVNTANSAVSTANSAVSTANTALSNSNTAISTANSALAAVSSAVIYTPVTNLTALAALTPTNGDYFELTDSTGAESSALITGVTVGLVGAPGLTFRLRYDAPPGIFTFLGYFANDSETRYLKLTGGTLTGQLRGDDSTSASTPGFAFDGDPNTGVGRSGADELALITGGTARVTIDPAGAVAIPGTLGVTGATTSSAFIPSGSTVPTNGVYLSAANTVAISTNSTLRHTFNAAGEVVYTPLTVGGTVEANSAPGTSAAIFKVANTEYLRVSDTGLIDATGDIRLKGQADLRFADADSSNYVAFQAPATVASNVTWTLPATDATVAGHALKSNAAGVLSWGTAGGATGGGGDDVFYENAQTVTTSYTLTTNKNAMSAGPITINSGATVTIPSGQSWTIV